jgi:glycosyltransferase involved in cell wall biosynthesis
MGKTMPPRYVIATQHPKNGGGVYALGCFIEELIKKQTGETPTWIFNSYSWNDENARILRKAETSTYEFDGRQGICIGRRGGPIEPLGYFLNTEGWKKSLRPDDIIIAVFGHMPYALPLAILKRKFVVWTATTYIDERFQEEASWSAPYKILQKIYKPILFRMEKKVVKEASKIIGLSVHTSRSIRAQHVNWHGRMCTIHCPVNSKDTQPGTEAEKEDRILYAGRFNDRRKNIHFLLDAFAELASKYPSWKLTLLGDEVSPALLKKVKDKGLEDKVEFPGFVSKDTYKKYFKSARIFTLCSKQEGQAIVVLEAMAAGLPIVVTKNGGTDAFMDDGENGFLVEKDSLPEFVKALDILITDAKKRTKMSQHSRHLLETYYDQPISEEKFLNVFNEIWLEVF